MFAERWFGKSWRDVRLVLYSDSVLAWYQPGGELLGGLRLAQVSLKPGNLELLN